MNINFNEIISKINSIVHVRFFLNDLINKLNTDLYSKSEIDGNFIKSDEVKRVVVLTEQEYNELITKDANTEYNIIES